MTLLDGGLQAVFGTAFAALYGNGVLHKAVLADDGQGGFTAVTTDTPVKVVVDSLSEQDRAAAGLPRTAVRLSVLCFGLPAGIDIDDSLTVAGATYRVVQVQAGAAGVSLALTGVPA